MISAENPKQDFSPKKNDLRNRLKEFLAIMPM